MGKRNGVDPPGAEGWVQISEFEHSKRSWAVWLKAPISPSGWADLKVVLSGRTKFKANYRVSFSVTEKRFARSSETVKLVENGMAESVQEAIRTVT